MKTVNVGIGMIIKEVNVLEKAAHELRELVEKVNGHGKSPARMARLLAGHPMHTKELAKKLGLAKVTVYTIGRKNRKLFSLHKGEWSVKH